MALSVHLAGELRNVAGMLKSTFIAMSYEHSMNSAEIRQKFLDYFASKGHHIVASSSLVPGNDPTLLFTNSGMVQFKDVFTGKDKRPYSRATTSQRSLRAGGKHNDLENVGYTARHHTFFEMLGNFSFGDYFKRDAINYAWELLTDVYQLPAEKLWVTVYAEDDEAYQIWAKEIGVPAERIVRIGDNKGAKYASDNFWQMADTGPCGPCSEIFYDHGADVWGGPPGSKDEHGDRYIEIWNLVFMQFNRDDAGVLHPLPKPSVDTGMGLERIAAVLQHVHSNYEIDLFQQLIQAAARETHCLDLAHNSLKVIADHIRACAFLIVDGVIPGSDGRGYVLRRIIRRAIRHGYQLGRRQPFFYNLVKDLCGVMGEAYPELVAARQQVMAVLEQEEERFGETIEHGMELLDAALSRSAFGRNWVTRNVFGRDLSNFSEYERGVFIGGAVGEKIYFDFLATAANGKKTGVRILDLTNGNDVVTARVVTILRRLDQFRVNPEIVNDIPDVFMPVIVGDTAVPEHLARIMSAADFNVNPVILSDKELSNYRTLDGETAFRLYDTHGFPLDLTADICRERNVAVDDAGFERAMQRQREMARAASSFKMKGSVDYDGAPTEFRGYETLEEEATVLALYRDGTRVNELNAGEEGIVVLDRTPFYAESGGQVGDCGELVRGAAASGLFEVADTQKIQADVFGHQGRLKAGGLAVGERVTARVNATARHRTAWNHSATHLLHAALREVLGKHVQQKGSLVDARRTRFDFSQPQPMTAREIARVEALVNREIQRNVEVNCRTMSYDDAIKAGAMALFGEKYGDEVRVIGMGEYSTELCGGTHVQRSGDIGLFKIVAEGGVAAGIRRVEAVTGEEALSFVQQLDAQLADIAAQVKTQPQAAAARVAQILDGVKALEKELARLKSKLAATQGDDLASQAIDIGGVKVLAAVLEGADNLALRDTLDKLKDKLKSAVIVLGSVAEGKVALIAGVTADLTAKVKAGELVNAVALQVGGKGGGRPDMAQAGGTQSENLAAALASVKAWVEQRL